MRLTSRLRPIDGAAQRVSLYRFQRSTLMRRLLRARSGEDGLALRLERREQLVEGLDELLHALLLELLRRGREIDAGLRQLREIPLRAGEVLGDARRRLAVIAVGV